MIQISEILRTTVTSGKQSSLILRHLTIKLATETDRASAFVVDPVKFIFLTSSLIAVQNLVVVSHTVRACRLGPKNSGALPPPP